jgi:alanine racemase
MAAGRAVARIDLGAVESNCRLLVERLEGGAELCAVVKAEGYGHGALACAKAALAGGATRLAVATAAEAAALRAEFGGTPLLTMGALTPEELDVALGAGSDIAVWREEFRALAAERARSAGRPARVHVKHDSGMGRLGTADAREVAELARACHDASDLELAGVWTHFATADELDDEYFGEQLGRFEPLAAELRSTYPDITVHAANSATVFRDPGAHFDMARCGIAIYGLDPFGEDPEERGLRPALELHSYVADVKRFPAGASAGYGRTWSAAEDTWVGVLPIGYGDGVRRNLSNNAEVLVGGARKPLVGTVSMDNTTIELGSQTEVKPGDPAVLIGRQGDERILAEELADRLGTINYEVTCGISSRVPRVTGEAGNV